MLILFFDADTYSVMGMSSRHVNIGSLDGLTTYHPLGLGREKQALNESSLESDRSRERRLYLLQITPNNLKRLRE